MVTGLGGTPEQELYIVYGHLHQALEASGVEVARSLVGEYVTSLDMAGAAVTLLRLDDELRPPLGRPRLDARAALVIAGQSPG